MTDTDETLDAEGRIRLYMELFPQCHNFGDDIAFDSRFVSEEWPRRAYAITRPDLDAVLAELARLRDQIPSLRKQVEEERTSWMRLHDAFNMLLTDAQKVMADNGVVAQYEELKETREEIARLHKKLENARTANRRLRTELRGQGYPHE